MRRSFSSLLLASCLATSVVASFAWPHSAAAQAQVSDADREAARSLFKEGAELQTAGDYAGALDRFKRSAQVFQAPTTILHIAECEARLLHLVEAAEAYRALGRMQFPAGNAAFSAAQQQGAAELQQIEPRIPHVRIQVTPANVPNLVVFIDEQPMNMALLGVDRPVDPGDHKFTAQAPGYARTETVVRIEEKQPTRVVSLALAAGAPGIAPIPYAPYGAQPQVVYAQPGQYVTPGYPAASPGWTNGKAVTPVEPVVAGPEPSRKGLFFGPRIGYILPVASGSVGNSVTGGFSLGVEADFRFARRLYVGAVVDHGFLGVSNDTSNGFNQPSVSASTTNFDVTFGVITSPDKFSGIFQAAFGYRTLSASESFEGQSVSASQSGPEGGLAAGFWIPIGSHFRLAPRLDVTVAALSGDDSSSTTFASFTFVLGAYPNFNF